MWERAITGSRQETLARSCAVNAWRGHPVQAQSRHDGDGLPMSARRVADQPLAARTVATQLRHHSVGGGLIDKHHLTGRRILVRSSSGRRVRVTSARFCSSAYNVLLKLRLCCSQNRHSAVRLPAIRAFFIAIPFRLSEHTWGEHNLGSAALLLRLSDMRDVSITQGCCPYFSN